MLAELQPSARGPKGEVGDFTDFESLAEKKYDKELRFFGHDHFDGKKI